MRYMNDYDIAFARQRFGRGSTPNRLALAIMVERLAELADDISDGWAYWPKPCRAAARAIELIESRTSRENDEQERNDITEAEMLAAVKPVKAFLTRHRQIIRPERAELVLRSTRPMFEVI